MKSWKFPIIKRSFLWLTLGLVAIITSLIALINNFRLSIQFTGGMEIKYTSKEVKDIKDDLKIFLGELWYKDITINQENYERYQNILIKTDVENDSKVAELSKSIQKYLVDKKVVSGESEILESSIIGPSIWAYMQSNAIKALIYGMIFLSVYMVIAFIGIKDVISPWVLALITIITMLFDIIIPSWAYGILMYFNQTIQIDVIFITAILTVMWYSINDTIVIFDRIRENIIINQKSLVSEKITYGKIFEDSLRQTMKRSILTGWGTIIVIVTMFIFGEGMIKTFAFTMFAWILSGTFSSIFIAAPLAYIVLGKMRKEKNKF